MYQAGPSQLCNATPTEEGYMKRADRNTGTLRPSGTPDLRALGDIGD